MLSIGERFLWFLVSIILDFLVQAVSRDNRDSDYPNTCLVLSQMYFYLETPYPQNHFKLIYNCLFLLWGFSFPLLFLRFSLFSGAWIDYFIVLVSNWSQGRYTHGLQVIWICIFKSLYLHSCRYMIKSIYNQGAKNPLAAFQIHIANYSTAL